MSRSLINTVRAKCNTRSGCNSRNGLWNAVTTITLLTFCSPDAAYAGQVVVPIPSIQVIDNTCTTWNIIETYTATPVDENILEELRFQSAYGWKEHFHAGGYPGGGGWGAYWGMEGSPSDKLATINRSVFGVSEPPVGMTSTYRIHHGGTCAADEGLRECVGIFVSNTRNAQITREPTTFPMGVCSGVPPAGVSCLFESSYSPVDLGTGGRGTRVGTTSVSVRCSRPVVYRVSEVPGTVDPDSMQIVTLRVEGGPLPYVSPGTQATENLTIEVEAKVSSEGFLSTQRVLRIDIP